VSWSPHKQRGKFWLPLDQKLGERASASASPGALAQFICHFHNWRLGLEDAAAATNALTQIKGLVGGVRLRRRRQQPLSTAPPSLKSVQQLARFLEVCVCTHSTQ